MEKFLALLWIWLLHAVFAGVLAAPIAFLGRKRVHWRAWELFVLVLPFFVWAVLMSSKLSIGKSLANLSEPFWFALAVPVAALVRVAVGSRVSERACAASLIALVCVAAAAVFFIVPPLPE
jgi:hypothetical protein